MTRFGTAGNSDLFYAEGNKASECAPEWLAGKGLSAYEFQAGHGVMIGEATARKLGEAAAAFDVAVSIHAPYYINLGSDDPEKYEKNIGYLLASAQAADWMGGSRAVFHLGTPGKRPREEAMRSAEAALQDALARMEAAGLSRVALCPETMGRVSQLGTLDEVLSLCARDERLSPALDFGHLHTIGLGALNGEADFDRVLDALIGALGMDRAKHFHAHFSKIEYAKAGEKRHVTFADPGYGPDFAHLAPALLRRGLEPTLICESRGTQAEDAVEMRRIYLGYAQGAPPPENPRQRE